MKDGRRVRVTGKQGRRVRRQLAAVVSASVMVGLLSLGVQPGQAADPVKVGILHSLSGTMAISEAPIKEVVLMAIDEINAAGGVLGRKVEPVIEDPASDWPLFAEKAKKLLQEDKVAYRVWVLDPVSRKSSCPSLSKTMVCCSILYSTRVRNAPKRHLYRATINQQASPAVDYLMGSEGGNKKRFYLIGTDYVYPRTTNKILRLYLLKKGVKATDIQEEYTPFHHQDYQTIVGKIKSFCAGGDAAVINTINGDSNVPFFKELANQGVTADNCPSISFSFAEVELQALDVKPLAGHLASWNYYMSLKTPQNIKWIKSYKDWCAKRNIPDKQCVTDDPMMHAYIHVHLWAKAVAKAGSTEVDKVLKALEGLEIDSPVGKYKVDEKNHHTWKPVYIGKIKEDGQFDIVSKTSTWVAPEPWSELTYPGRACDWSGDGKGSFDMVDGKRSWLSDKK
jgi:urea transport system substrate-binding protein